MDGKEKHICVKSQETKRAHEHEAVVVSFESVKVAQEYMKKKEGYLRHEAKKWTSKCKCKCHKKN